MNLADVVRRLLAGREEKPRVNLMGIRRAGSTLHVRVEPSRVIERVRVHVQLDGAAYTPGTYVQRVDVSCHESRVQNLELEVTPGEGFALWAIPLIRDGSGVWLEREEGAAFVELATPPETFVPEPHALDGDRHTGNLPVARVDGAVADGGSASLSSLAVSDYFQASGLVLFDAGFEVGSPMVWTGAAAAPISNLPVGSNVVPNLNSHFLNGFPSSDFARPGNAAGDSWAGAQSFNAVCAFNGAAQPFTVASTGRVDNLNADLLDGLDSTHLLALSNHTGTLSKAQQHAATGYKDESNVGASAWTGQQEFNRNGINNIHSCTTDSRVEYHRAGVRRGYVAWNDAIFQIIPDGVGLRLGAAASLVGFYGTSGVARAAAIASPTGGATVDTESRAAIDSIRTVLKNIGITS